MTRFQALFIKLLRVRLDYSWRAVHAEWQKRYLPEEEWYYNSAITPEIRAMWYAIIGETDDRPDGNQLVGIRLCEEAMNYLGEEIEDGWN